MSAVVQEANERATRSVFVGNIPYEATEETMKEIFQQVGPVVSFRIVYDRESGKPKGYGFCEYQDIATAESAKRNLNNTDYHGRPLRVGAAAGDQSNAEMKAMQQGLTGPIMENPYGEATETEKAPEAISKAVASLPPEQMFELMKQMKLCVQNNPNEARNMLLQNPQLAYALLQAQIVMKIVDPQVAMAMLHRKSDQIPPVMPSSTPTPAVEIPQVQTSRPEISAPTSSPQIPASLASLPGLGGLPRGLLGDRPLGERPAPTRPEPVPAPMQRDMGPPRDFDARLEMGGPPRDVDIRQMGGPPRDFDARGGMMGGPMGGPMRDGGGPFRNMVGPGPMFDQGRDPQRGPMMGPGQRGPGRPDMGPGPGRPDMGPGPGPHGRADMGPDRGPADPRDMRDPRGGGDPRGRGPLGPPQGPARGPPPAPSGGGGGGAGVSAQDQEKAALIMQVLKLSDEQIAMLPPDQRSSILILREQISSSGGLPP